MLTVGNIASKHLRVGMYGNSKNEKIVFFLLQLISKEFYFDLIWCSCDWVVKNISIRETNTNCLNHLVLFDRVECLVSSIKVVARGRLHRDNPQGRPHPQYRDIPHPQCQAQFGPKRHPKCHPNCHSKCQPRRCSKPCLEDS